ncbi:heteromeric transposase endonuclease subunit TnsA [Paenibacillus sp. LMG 31456]|uniref:Heteromeric transposase endonuclease subunit TnsA n=1 Tax=Paenibacillus foliorum TaxID=2654974 RepID=A0A972JZM8_9BACL|nr:TnsA endonuclease N-terminal domain-containing protein [Paenibacillus foliorum]NOU93771.1 heteromeric transposase endonuclease subunit TnsA [Paenibacillus foliorum]
MNKIIFTGKIIQYARITTGGLTAMAKFKYAVDENTIAKRLKEGRGSGTGSAYLPWIRVHEVPSIGKSSIRSSWKTEREHHFLSNLEAMYFYLLEWDDSVVDMREQFPLLPREETQAIAAELGIKHPADPKTKVDIVMTTDNVITNLSEYGQVIKARSIKYENALNKRRTAEKQLIEKIYWSRRGVEWNVVTENSIHIPLVQNIQMLHKSKSKFGLFPNIDEVTLKSMEEKLMKLLPGSNKIIANLTDVMDKYYNVPASTSLTLLKHLIVNKKLNIDMLQLFNPCKQVKITIPC